MKPFGLCYPVYNNQAAFDCLADKLSQLPCPITIVDDGSNPPLDIKNQINIKLLRIDYDRMWNQPQANNVAINNCDCDVILRLDIDHYVEPNDYPLFEKVALSLPPKTIFQFERIRIDTNEKITPNPNMLMFRKGDFIAIGGYNEEFCGNYGYDDMEFLFRARKLGYQIATYPLVIYTIPENKTPNVVRDTARNRELLRRLTNDGR